MCAAGLRLACGDVHQRADEAARGPRFTVRLVAGGEGGASDVQMDPGLAVNEPLQEFGGGNGSAPAAAGVLDVADVPLDQVVILIPGRKLPEVFAGCLGCGEYGVAPGLVVREAPATSSPRATTQAPVSVARSMIRSTPRSTA